MAERIEMSEREVNRLEVVIQVAQGLLSQRKAGERLGLSERQVRRLLRGYETQGAQALVSQRRGRASNRRIAGAVKSAILARVQECYADFGPTLAVEYLQADGYTVSKETLRQWLIEADQWKAKPEQPKRRHPPRQRRSCVGELVQIDGSPHDWFEGRGPRCTLIAFIDDATSRVQEARFVPAETTQAYFDCLHTYIRRYGRPAALYSDRHSIFTKHDPEDAEPTQFQRALSALDIAGIQARSPQAKGRVERLFQTLQDRLTKALRLANIADMESANAMLPAYLDAHNERFAVAPIDTHDAHRPCALSAQVLARLCAHHDSRKLSKDLVLSFQRQRYIIQTGGTPRYSLRGATVTVVSYADGRIELLRGDEILPFKVFDPLQHVLPAADDKTLNARVDEVLAQQRQVKKYHPAPDHPWRTPRPLAKAA